MTDVPAGLVEALRRTVRGRVSYPADPTYDARVPADGPRPMVVIQGLDENDMAAAMTAATVHGIHVSIEPQDDAALFLLDRLDIVSVNPTEGTVLAGAGVRPGDVALFADPTAVLQRKVLGTDGFVRLVAENHDASGVVLGTVYRLQPQDALVTESSMHYSTDLTTKEPLA